jgi:hypothetical protein
LPGLFEELRRRGWKRKFLFRRVFTYKLIKKGGVEAFSHARRGPYQTSTEDIIASAEMIDGVPFMNLNELRAFKLAMGREKDMRDVELIDKFQNKS